MHKRCRIVAHRCRRSRGSFAMLQRGMRVAFGRERRPQRTIWHPARFPVPMLRVPSLSGGRGDLRGRRMRPGGRSSNRSNQHLRAQSFAIRLPKRASPHDCRRAESKALVQRRALVAGSDNS